METSKPPSGPGCAFPRSPVTKSGSDPAYKDNTADATPESSVGLRVTSIYKRASRSKPSSPMSGITKRIRSASRHRSLGNAASLTGLDGLGDGSDSGSDIMSGHASEVSDPEDNNNAAPESPEKKRRPRGAKMVRGLSKAARRLRNRSIGSTEALTLGRVGVSSRRSNAIWLNDAGIDVPSPEHRSSSRKMPEWNHPPLSKGAEVHSPTTLSSGDPSPGGVNISTVPRRPSMTRGRTAPPSSSEHGYKSSFDGGDMTALMEGSAAKLALDSTEDVRRWRGRSRKAKSSSPPKSRSGSPSVHRQASRLSSPSNSEHSRISRSESRSLSPGRGSRTSVHRVWESFRQVKGISLSHHGGITPILTTQRSEDSPSDARKLRHSLGCAVKAAPPSSLKYGDRLRLMARCDAVASHSESVNSGGISGGTGGWTGYVGSREKVQKVGKRMFRRSEMAVIAHSEGHSKGFNDCHFKAVDPDGKHEDGDVVHYGDSVLLVDDRNLVWNDNVHGFYGSLRMKAQGSKTQVVVRFEVQGWEHVKDPEERFAPVVFGTQGLEIWAVDFEAKESRLRRIRSTNSKKQHALTAYTKKSNKNSTATRTYLCSVGRGERIAFEVHLPNASSLGDPVPVVTKVKIHPEERSSLHVQLRSPPAMHDGGELSSEFSTVALSSATTDFGGSAEEQATSDVATTGSGKFFIPQDLRTVRHNYNHSGESKLSPRMLASPRSELSGKGGDEDDDEEDEVGSDTESGGLQGLKWGAYVQFRMPGDAEEIPDDLLLTLRLSNGFTASLTRQQFNKYAGQGKFPVEARKIKSPDTGSKSSSDDPDLPEGNGVVYLSCNLSAHVCHDSHEAAAASAAAKYAVSTHEESETVGAAILKACVAAVASLVGGAFQGLRELWDSDWRASKKPNVSTGMGVAILTLISMVSVVVLFTPPTPSAGKMTDVRDTKSHAPAPCTSIWELRRSDGTAYPHQQLSAAAAVLNAAPSEYDLDEGEDTLFVPPSEVTRPNTESIVQSDGDGSASDNRMDPRDRVTGGGPNDPAADSPSSASVGMGLAGGLGEESPEKAVKGRGAGTWGLLSLFVLTLAGTALTIAKAMLWRRSTSRDKSVPVAMQAQVYLLGWDGRDLTEVDSGESNEDIYYQPPSGSKLAPMPHRFLLAESMDKAKAWARWEDTLDWRKENNADIILSKPQPRFSLIKSKYPHCFHLPDNGGRLTYYERPGLANFADMKKAGITRDHLLQHYMFCMEYLWQVLQPSQTQRITIVIDLAGVRVMDLVGESMAFLKTTVGMMSKHYPQRSFKIMILNAPSFFNTVFAAVKPMLNEATKKKIDLLPVAYAGVELKKVIPSDHLPVHYGGTGKKELMESPAEERLLAHVQDVLEKNGVAMAK